MNIDASSLTKVHALLGFPLFFSHARFLTQDSIQDTTLQLLVMSPGSSRLTASQTFFVFNDLDSFEDDWSGILGTVPQLGFVWCVAHD